MSEFITGFVHTDPSLAFTEKDKTIFATVRVVEDLRFFAGTHVGVMYLTDGTDLDVYQHPCGNYLTCPAKE